MNLDDLKEVWKSRHIGLDQGRFDELASRALASASSFEQRIMRRDLVESAAATIVIAACGYVLWLDGYPLAARLGVLMIILGTIEIMVVLHWARRSHSRLAHDLPLIHYCVEEVARVDRQIRLLRTVSWWYTSPVLIGACVFMYGVMFSVPVPLYISVPGFATLCLLFLIFGWGIYRINQRAILDDLVPLRDELSAIRDSLTEVSQSETTKP